MSPRRLAPPPAGISAHCGGREIQTAEHGGQDRTAGCTATAKLAQAVDPGYGACVYGVYQVTSPPVMLSWDWAAPNDCAPSDALHWSQTQIEVLKLRQGLAS